MCDECDEWEDDYSWHCRQCIREYFTLCGQIITCQDCGEEPIKSQLEKYLKKKDWKKYQEQKSIKVIRSMKNIVSCPGLDCPMYYWKSKKHKKCKKGKCIECKLKWCILCNAKWKKGHKEKCVGMIIIPKSVMKSRRNFRTREEKFGFCPFCKATTVKISGCPSVDCGNCDTNYCFKCKKQNIRCKC